jgi:hypothetical protein
MEISTSDTQRGASPRRFIQIARLNRDCDQAIAPSYSASDIHRAERPVEDSFGLLDYNVTVIRISHPRFGLAELLEVSLGDESLHVALSNIELAILGQSYRPGYHVSRLYKQGEFDCHNASYILPVFRLYLSCILQHPHVYEQVPRRL